MESTIPSSATALKEAPAQHFPLPIKWIAQLFSIVFHPLFIPAMATWYLVYWQPQYFPGVGTDAKLLTFIKVAYNTIFYPALTVILLRALGFLKSIQMPTQRDRIIPFIATNIFYFWTYLVFKNTAGAPIILISFLLGIFLASSIGLLANIYFKISMHALGVGAFMGLALVIIFSGFPFVNFLPVLLIFLMTGLVCTSRLIVSNHTPFEIYSGILVAIIAQFAAYIIITMM